MNRRQFVAVGSASVIAALPIASAAQDGQTRFTAGYDFGDVFLDGEKVEYVVTADTRDGYIEQFVRDPNGNFVRSKDSIARVRRYGRVLFIRRRYPF